MEAAIAWKCGDIWFLKKGRVWLSPEGYTLCYVYGNTATERLKRLTEVKKGASFIFIAPYDEVIKYCKVI